MSANQRISLLMLLCITVFSTSCMQSAVKGLLVNSAKYNKLLLHRNPKAGDYSIMQSDHDTSTSKVIAVTSDSVKIRVDSSAFPDLIYEWVVDFDGNVKKVDVIDASKNHERIPCRILKPGDSWYRDFVKMTAEQLEAELLSAPAVVKRMALEYEVEGYKITSAEKDVYNISLINNNVKFLVVASYTMINGEIYFTTKLLESGNKK